jgi:hypothetical protein
MSRILISLTPKMLRAIDSYVARQGHASRCEAIRVLLLRELNASASVSVPVPVAVSAAPVGGSGAADAAAPAPQPQVKRVPWRPPAPGQPEDPVLATEEQAQWVAQNLPAHTGWPLNPGKLSLPNISYTAGDCRRYERTSQLPDMMLPLRDDCYAWITAHDPPWRARMDKQDKQDGVWEMEL